MALLDYAVAVLAVLSAGVLWTMLTFVALEVGDRRLYRWAPLVAGGVAGVIVATVRGLSGAVLVGALTAGLLFVLDRLLLDRFEVVRADLDEETPRSRDG
ncbi:MAG: hypothetical protein ABEJ35_05790 [Halobacteriaceae archaeon]